MMHQQPAEKTPTLLSFAPQSDEEKPGCETHTSIYLPTVAGEPMPAFRARIRHQILQARRLLNRSLDHRTLRTYVGEMLERVNDIEVASHIRGIALFKNSNGIRFYCLQIPPPEIVVVANSYHIKPLLFCRSLQYKSHVVRLTYDSATLYLLNTNGLEKLKTIVRNGDRSFGGAEKKHLTIKDLYVRGESFARSAAFSLLSAMDSDIEDVAMIGPKPLRDAFLRTLPKGRFKVTYCSADMVATEWHIRPIQDAIMKVATQTSNLELALRMSDYPNQTFINSIDSIGKAACNGKVATLFVDPYVQIFGTYNRYQGDIEIYPKQLGTWDDCVIDDIAEEVLKRNGKIRFFDSKQVGRPVSAFAVLHSA